MFEDLMPLFNIGMGSSASQAMDAGQAEELAKTLQITHAAGTAAPGSLAGGSAMVLESLDGVLKSVTYDASNLVFWPSIAQDRAYALVEQYVRTNSYGDGGSPYIPEAGSPAMNDSEYNRHAQKVVFFSTRRGVPITASLVRMIGNQDAEAREAQAGTLWMLERLERELYKGLADFSNAGTFDGHMGAVPTKLQNLNLAGAEQQIRDGDSDFSAQARAFDGYGASQSVIISKDGDVLEESDFEELANRIVENFGRPDQCHMSPKNMSDFIRQFYPKERVNTLGVADGRAGYIVREMVTTAGGISMKPNVFLKPKQAPKSQNDRTGVPSAPASATATQGAASSKLKSGDAYTYQVSACNEQGEGAALATSNTITVTTDGNQVNLAIADPSGGPTPTHYAVYRTDKSGAGEEGFIGFAKRTGTTTTFIDLGNKSPSGAAAYMLDMRPESLVWKQLAPLMKINLAQVTTAKEFLLWLAGCMTIYAPRKSGMFENIGKS